MQVRCSPLLTLPMGATSSPDPPTTLFESGMWRRVLQLEILWRGIQTRCGPLLTLQTGSTSLLGLLIKPPVYGTYFCMFPSHLPLVTQSILSFMRSLTWVVGSGTQEVAYYTGYPMIFVQACIHPPFLQSPLHLMVDPFLLTLTTLPLELHGLKFSKVHLLNLFFPLNSAHVLVALLVIKVSPMVPYPFLRLVGLDHYCRKDISPRNLEVKSANNSGTTQVKRSYRIAARRRSKVPCTRKTRMPRSVRTLETILFLPMGTVHL